MKNGKITPDNGYYHLPYIVCICDEYADLIMGADKALKKSIQAFYRMRQTAAESGFQDMTLDEINEEIRLVRDSIQR